MHPRAHRNFEITSLGILATTDREDGYTVAESTIAAALLSTVLLMLVGALAHLGSHHAQRDRIAGLFLAQAAIETSIDRENYESAVWRSANGRWTVERISSEEDNTVQVTIRVWRARGDDTGVNRSKRPPLVQLSTNRFAQ
jgi:hypothetical protein